MRKIDGSKLTDEIIGRLNIKSAVLKIILIGNDRASEVFVEKKRRIAERLRVDFELKKSQSDVSEIEIINQIKSWQGSKQNPGIVIQLPTPEHLNRDNLIRAIKPENDVDGMRYCLEASRNLNNQDTRNKQITNSKIQSNAPTPEESGPTSRVFPQRLPRPEAPGLAMTGEGFIPPVVLAIDKAISESRIDLKDKKIVIVGQGFLVGQPLFGYLSAKYPESIIIASGKDDRDLTENIKQADVVIGAASAGGIITPEMIKSGAVLIDAGSAEVDGALRGNIDQECYAKASYYTPVPGGIGPLTIAYLFQNLSKESNNPPVIVSPMSQEGLAILRQAQDRFY